jgi:hypothetical protein
MRFDPSRQFEAGHPAVVAHTLRQTGHDSSRRVLLLTSGLGLGHVRAAQAIEAALRDCAEVHTLDLWSLMNAGVARVIHETYLSLVQNYPDLYQRLYTLDEQTWRQILESESGPPPAVLEVLALISAIALELNSKAPRGGRYASDKLLLSLLCTALPYDVDSLAGNGVRARLAVIKWSWLRLIRRLDPAIRRLAPDVIVSTQMIPAAMTSYLKQRGKVSAPLIGVMTDFGVHDFWKQRGVDRYCVAHESITGNIEVEFPHAREIAASGTGGRTRGVAPADGRSDCAGTRRRSRIECRRCGISAARSSDERAPDSDAGQEQHGARGPDQTRSEISAAAARLRLD